MRKVRGILEWCNRKSVRVVGAANEQHKDWTPIVGMVVIPFGIVATLLLLLGGLGGFQTAYQRPSLRGLDKAFSLTECLEASESDTRIEACYAEHECTSSQPAWTWWIIPTWPQCEERTLTATETNCANCASPLLRANTTLGREAEWPVISSL